MSKRLKVGFLADSYIDPDRVDSWSGLPYYFAKHMRAADCEVVKIHGCDTMGRWSEKLKQAAWQFGGGKRYVRGLSRPLMRAYSDSIQSALKQAPVEIIFSASSWLISELRTELPVVFWTDATFSGMHGYYESFTNLAPPSVACGHAIERAALARATLAVYSNHWAAESAIRDYGADPAKVRVLNFGANLTGTPDKIEMQALLDERGVSETCELLFVGVDWKRKGADIAVEAYRELRGRGVRARLRIVGCKPPAGFNLPEGVEVLGFVNKSSTEGRERLDSLYRSSHFFIMPSRAEASAVALCEACAYGLPCLSADTGGLRSIVTNDINGCLFKPGTGGAGYAHWITDVWNTPNRYREIASGAHEVFQTRLNGSRCVRELVGWMEELIPAAAVR